MCYICECEEKNIQPDISLTFLDCWGCTSLTTIPNTIVNINVLVCKGCTSLTTIPNNIYHVNSANCKWIERNSSNIKKLKECQSISRNYIKRRREKIWETLQLPKCLKGIVFTYIV